MLPSWGNFQDKNTYYVAGENPSLFGNNRFEWEMLLDENKPRGIICLIDDTRPSEHKATLNAIIELIEKKDNAKNGNLKAVFILVNKQDVWKHRKNIGNIMENYTKEYKKLQIQSERFRFKLANYSISLKDNKSGVGPAMSDFINTIRYDPR